MSSIIVSKWNILHATHIIFSLILIHKRNTWRLKYFANSAKYVFVVRGKKFLGVQRSINEKFYSFRCFKVPCTVLPVADLSCFLKPPPEQNRQFKHLLVIQLSRKNLTFPRILWGCLSYPFGCSKQPKKGFL